MRLKIDGRVLRKLRLLVKSHLCYCLCFLDPCLNNKVAIAMMMKYLQKEDRLYSLGNKEIKTKCKKP